jgi:predicted alpha/beta superfamily hydrolase
MEQNYSVSHEDRAWFGHSFGGLFGTYALFNSQGLPTICHRQPIAVVE